MCRNGYSSHPASRNSCFGCARLIRLLDELVNPRLEHLAELLVEGIAEGAAGAGGTGRRRGGVRAGVAGRGRRRGGRRTASARGAFPAHRGAGAAAALARRRLLTNAAGARVPARSWTRISPATFRSCPRSWSSTSPRRASRASRWKVWPARRPRPSPVVAPPAIIVARAPAGSGLERGLLRLLKHREEEERLRGAGTAHRRGEGGRKDDRSTVGRAHAHVEAPLSA